MKGKPTLYELLGVTPSVAAAELRAAYRLEMNGLEGQRAAMSPDDFNDRAQLLRLAFSTLSDPVSRTGYDAELAAAARPAAPARTLAIRADAPAASAEVRADALGLRADALSLRADAMLARAGIDTALARPEPSFAGGLLVSAKYVVRAIGLLAVIGALTFGVTRCGMSGSVQQRSVIEARASEQAALQEYYQAHGVRPANMAELELMETARRRKENDARQADQERRRQDDEQRRFEQESRRRGEEIGYQLRLADEAASQRAERERERERELKFREEQLRLEIELTANPADRSRLELQRQQLRRQLQKP